ncbi:hypothetical protein HCJ92_02490 [Streptomyces sp. ventii]|uniref:MmyB-like transcription regulator ligand binding domain-containing protein n=1 Tax=Streptomyces spiramenti TaxID=2720606 RepID=A0ABX1ALM1_9ACTN|nr:hypothetical protein [Streptomyces spiramenti]NJP65180.1 hypothetical protein [Streptomyces spiramenti]
MAHNALGRALYAPVFTSGTAARHGRANIARYTFLDPGAQDFFTDWDTAYASTAALLRAEAGRRPHDRALRELIGDLSTLSTTFRTVWASHDVRIHHDGTKKLHHPEAGRLELIYQSLTLPLHHRDGDGMTLYTAAPGSAAEDQLRLLGIWTAAPADHKSTHPTEAPQDSPPPATSG